MSTRHSSQPPSLRALPRSLTRALKIFEVLAAQEGGLNLTQLANLLDCPKSSLVSLLAELAAQGYLVRSEKKYALGAATFRMSAAVGSRGPSSFIHAVMSSMSARTEHTIAFSVFSAAESAIVFRHVIQSRRLVRYIITPGERRSLIDTCSGRTALAFCESEWRKQFLRTVRASKQFVGRLTELERSLAGIRKTGSFSSFGRFSEGLGIIAAPILDESGSSVGVLHVAGAQAELKEDEKTLTKLVCQSADEISRFIRTHGIKDGRQL